MNNITRKQNIKQIPTRLNYFYNTNKRINKLRKQGNTSRLLIIGLIIWNLVTSMNYFKSDMTIPQFTDKQNKEIMIEEFIPPYDLLLIDTKEIN